MSGHRVIWQYWETRGEKPAFVDPLHDIARRNAGVPVIQVTPETLPEHLPDLDPRIHEIGELAHKADMIRTRLIARHGGMWLDSDAIVLRDLGWIFDRLEGAAFIGFTDGGRLAPPRPRVRINCFAAPPGSPVMEAWVGAQAALLDRRSFGWEEIGTALLDPICLAEAERVRTLPFREICPVSWRQVRRFGSRWRTPGRLLDEVSVVMLSNKALERRYPALRRMSVEEILASGIYLSHFLARALDPAYRPPPLWRRLTGRSAPGSAGAAS